MLVLVIDTNKVTMMDAAGTRYEYDLKPKQAVAKDIADPDSRVVEKIRI